jgi:hypothetical protein
MPCFLFRLLEQYAAPSTLKLAGNSVYCWTLLMAFEFLLGISRQLRSRASAANAWKDVEAFGTKNCFFFFH